MHKRRGYRKGVECLLLTSWVLDPSHFHSSCQIFSNYCQSQELMCLVSWRFCLKSWLHQQMFIYLEVSQQAYIKQKLLFYQFCSRSNFFVLFPRTTIVWAVLKGSSIAICTKGVDDVNSSTDICPELTAASWCFPSIYTLEKLRSKLGEDNKMTLLLIDMVFLP